MDQGYLTMKCCSMARVAHGGPVMLSTMVNSNRWSLSKEDMQELREHVS